MFQYLFGSGGAIANLEKLVRSIAENFPDMHIVVLCSPESDLRQLERYPNVEFEIYGEEKSRVIWRFRLGLRGLRRAAKKHGVDLVWSVNTGALGPLHCPQILQINNAYQVYPASYSRYHPRGKFAVSILKILCRLTARQSSMVVCQTETIAQYGASSLGYAGEIRVIGKAVEALAINNVDAHGTRRTGKPFRFGYVAANYGHKNHRVILKAASKISECADFELHLTLTPEEITAIGGQCAERLLRKGQVVAHGWVSSSNLSEFYGRMDGCLMPSLLESLSSSHLEAMYFQIPQIVADRPYAHELCGDAAIYVDPEDPSAWAAAMVRLIEDADLRDNMVGEGRARFRSLPQSWEEVARQWKNALVDAVKSGQSK